MNYDTVCFKLSERISLLVEILLTVPDHVVIWLATARNSINILMSSPLLFKERHGTRFRAVSMETETLCGTTWHAEYHSVSPRGPVFRGTSSFILLYRNIYFCKIVCLYIEIVFHLNEMLFCNFEIEFRDVNTTTYFVNSNCFIVRMVLYTAKVPLEHPWCSTGSRLLDITIVTW